ncbi:large conductance mechanosensitive channel protein MscL [Lutispora thermophila]|uniref:large conductance mechanosensitive channel protein MscL n=1 Tax=Lutispora thermophila TaxID=288966 RepID=UPI0009332A56|nr:large conductance mechanosensitive channel protein MscL [Lutispora thermophila]
MIILQEFKKFALRGNVLDLAIGVIIGGAFGEIVNSLVNDMLMPIIGLLLGGIDFSSLQITINDATIRYGAFIQSVVDFLIITFSIFIFIRAINRLKKKQEEKPAAPLEPTKEEILLTEIRDILKDKR